MELAIEPKVKGICYQKSDNCARRGKVVVWLVRGASVRSRVRTTVSRTIVSVFFPGYFPLASGYPAARGNYPSAFFHVE